MNDISHNLIKFPLLNALDREHINVARRASDSNDEDEFVSSQRLWGGGILSLAKNHRSDLLKGDHILLKPSKKGKL